MGTIRVAIRDSVGIVSTSLNRVRSERAIMPVHRPGPLRRRGSSAFGWRRNCLCVVREGPTG
jgi:hypothetical protein